MQVRHAGLELRGHLDAVGVKLELRRVEQRLLGRESRHDLVDGLDEVDDLDHRAVRDRRGDVAGLGIGQGGYEVGLAQLARPGALAVQDVAEALHQDVARAQHVAHAAHHARVLDRLVEGLAEIEGGEHRDVGVVGLALLVAVAVDHRQAAVVVLLAHKSARVLAEGADLVAEGVGAAHQFALVEHVVDGLHDLVAHLHAHAQVAGAGRVLDAVARAGGVEPGGAAAAGRNDGLLRADLVAAARVAHHRATADAVLDQQLIAFRGEDELHARILQVAFDARVQLLRLFRTQVADRAVHELEARLDRAAADLRDLVGVADALHVGVRAEVQVHPVDAVDGPLGEVRADEVGQVAAHLVRQRELAVRKGACARETGGDAAGLAVHADTRADLGTAAALDRQALLDDRDVAGVAAAEQAERAEDARRARAHDQDVGAVGRGRLVNICSHDDSSILRLWAVSALGPAAAWKADYWAQ